jgi:hypothetical protein
MGNSGDVSRYAARVETTNGSAPGKFHPDRSYSEHEPQNCGISGIHRMLLFTVLMAGDFINNVTGVLLDVVPAMALLRSLIYLLANLTVFISQEPNY